MPKGKYPRKPHYCTRCGEQDPTKFYTHKRGECVSCCHQRSKKEINRLIVAVIYAEHMELRLSFMTPNS